ncbi:hypothetical protein CALCODRAFT_492861 [Calocera cornea HHB12733]|uniref:Uncharacterized protein n=1 Tax=Calocera cornea HHB12733 TaxID=1353952 RepID=A0A165I3N5_9BASI|nr:hypothetical protein CALCODRAFT_492861 [Calocera cornea HHB12733]
MGRNAKLHKRVKKGKTSTASYAAPKPIPAAAPPLPPPVKKRIAGGGLKAKAKAISGGSKDGPLLGGADYVTLALGGRRKAQHEAEKLARVSGDGSGVISSVS